MSFSLKALLTSLCVLTAAAANAQLNIPGDNDNASIVQATMLADATAVQPDTTFTLGVLFKVKPGWHIYWRNPGSSGLATKVTWAIPEGGSNGDTLYPTPWAFTAPGDIVSYGYEDEVLLMTDARVAPNASGTVEINAKTRWLMCSDRCIPGKQDVSLKIPVGKGQPANAELFDKYRKQLPRHVNQLPAGVSVSKNQVTIPVTVNSGSMLAGEDQHPDLRRVFFFPDNIDGYVVETPKVSEPDASVTVGGKALKAYSKPATITYTAEPSGSATGPLRIAGVLVTQSVDSSGKAQPFEALEFDAPAPK